MFLLITIERCFALYIFNSYSFSIFYESYARVGDESVSIFVLWHDGLLTEPEMNNYADHNRQLNLVIFCLFNNST